MQLDTRAQARRILGLFDPESRHAILKLTVATLGALAAVFLPGSFGYSFADAGLSTGGQACLGILVFAAICWVTEALPAFAVALCVLALEIGILGRPGGVFMEAGDSKGWEVFVEPWASPIMWLFLGGFVLAHATSKVGLDRYLARIVLKQAKGHPGRLMAGVMALTFVLSMFMSNTATAAMMVALLAPVASGLPKGDKFAVGLYLSVPVAANIGGIATPIGSPPNAIVLGELVGPDKLDFLKWMIAAGPPAITMVVLLYFVLMKLYPAQQDTIAIPESGASDNQAPPLQGPVVVTVFLATIALWMTGSLHGIPPAVISFLPITVLAATGVLTSQDMRQLPWDVLLLLGGGLALGVGVKITGLAAWLAALAPTGLSFLLMVLIFMTLALVLSNLMSNTATASILAPLAGGLIPFGESPAVILVLIAIACSSAMCLPISTPPNAVAYASQRLQVKDFVRVGLICSVLAPLVAVPWVFWIIPKLTG